MLKHIEIKTETAERIISILVALLTVLICILPMDDLPLWNGTIIGHRNQYELMTESILNGRIDIIYGDEAELEKLNNPYDPVERAESGVRYHWDHAYYNGHYYMYFGIVPVFLAFLPYRLITGRMLTAFRATRFFTVVFILGFFLLFRLLTNLFFKKMPFGMYIGLSAVFSIMSVCYASAEPSLYCTAITAGMALEIWSLFFFIWAVYFEKRENRQILLAGIGALFGALVFGCRPTIGLANIIVLPLLAVFLKERRFSAKLAGKLALAALPYLLVAVGLMIYNYARFEDPFEFGQSYQLTVADQRNLGLTFSIEQLFRVFSDTISNFFAYGGSTDSFPFIKSSGAFFDFPVLFLLLASLFSPVRDSAKNKKAWPIIIGILVAVILITVFEVLWSPVLLERYKMDILFLMGIGCFLTIGLRYEESEKPKLFSLVIILLSELTLISSYLFYIRAVGNEYPDRVFWIAFELGLD